MPDFLFSDNISELIEFQSIADILLLSVGQRYLN